MLSCDNCRVRLTVIGFFLKIEKIFNNKVQSCKWLHRTNMYLPCDDEETSTAECTQFGANVVKPMANCIQVKTLCCDGMKTVASLGINCTYQYADVDYSFSSLAELCEFIATFRCVACESPSFPTDGFVLVWNNLENSLFETETDLNAYISGNGGTANFTGVNNLLEFNAQVFTGGSGVNLGDDFLNGNPNIIIIEDQLGAVTEQGNNNQSNCFILEKIDLNGLLVQGEGNQSNNAALSNLILSSLTTQTNKNQNDSIMLGTIELPALTTQGSDNQKNNAITTVISLAVLTTQGSNNQRNNTLATDILLPLLETQGSDNQSNNAALTKLILQALETQVDSNQISNNAMTTLTLASLTSQGISNQSNNLLIATLNMGVLTTQDNNNQNANPALTLISTPLLTSLGFGNYTGCTFPILTINVDASLFGAADILTAQAGGATIV